MDYSSDAMRSNVRSKEAAPKGARGLTLGEALKQARRFHPEKLSQERAAESIGMSRMSVYGWERDTSVPSLEAFVKLCRLYEVTPEVLGFQITDGRIVPLPEPAADRPTKMAASMLMLHQLAIQDLVDVPLLAPRTSGEWSANVSPRKIALPRSALGLYEGVAVQIEAGDRSIAPLATAGEILVIRKHSLVSPDHIVMIERDGAVKLRVLRRGADGLCLELGSRDPSPETLDEWKLSGVVIMIIYDYGMARMKVNVDFDGIRATSFL